MTRAPATNPNANTPAAQYCSLRRLSPYQGTVQVIEMPGFSAMSVDGVNWEVRLDNPGMRPTRALWRVDALDRIAPAGRIESYVAALQHRPALPFRLGDTLELWLLDARDALPLALLASALPRMTPPNTVTTQWRAAFHGDDDFVSPSLQAAAAAASDAPPAIAHAEILNRCVSKAAGARPRAQWFRRDAHGGGIGAGGSGLEATLRGREIEAAWFPELLLREEWESELEQNLVRDYHDWLAPSLLTQTHLRQSTRARLERAACMQAEKLYRVRELLPEVVEGELVEIALVEAVLRRASAP